MVKIETKGGSSINVKRNWRSILIFLFFIIDSISVFVSILLASWVRIFLNNIIHYDFEVLFQYGILFGSVFISLSLLFGVYRVILHSDIIRQYYLATKAFIYTFLSTFTILYIFETEIFPQKFSILFFFFLPFIYVINRLIFNAVIRYLQSKGYGTHNVLIVGYGNGGLSIICKFKNFPELGYNIKGTVTNQLDSTLMSVEIHGTIVQKY